MAKVTTFYSYKGGSGRSMAMANVAWALATNGESVLAIDWDLEAPGLHRYFHPFLEDPEQKKCEGLVDRIWAYIDDISNTEKSDRGRKERFALADCKDIVQRLELPVRSRGCLHLLSAGRQDDEYSAKIGGLDWSNFYARFDGEEFIDRLIDWARGNYTHILIDSRTGVADTAGICTAQLPDSVIVCVVYNRQSIEGSAAIARSIANARAERNQDSLDIRFIPCRVEERGAVDSARRFAAARLGDALKQRGGTIERQLRRDEIRHYPWCAFEEKLAVFEDIPDERGSLLDSMHELASTIAGRKRLKTADIDANVLATIWRRAAFDDPRIADLSALDELTLDTAYSNLLAWIDAALDDRDERPDWLIALGESAVSFAGRDNDREAGGVAEFIARNGLKIANRAMDQDPAQYTVRFALLLQSRAGQLQKQGEFEEALALANHSHRLLDLEKSPTSKWRAARSLERMAEITLASGKPDQAIEIYRKVVEKHTSIGWRSLPLGAAIDPSRVLRILAEMLLARGDLSEADEVAGQAVSQLGSLDRLLGRRDAAEVVNILATRAEIAALVNSDTADNEIIRARAYAADALGSMSVRAQLERRLSIAEARLLVRRAKYAAALSLVEKVARMDADPIGSPSDILNLHVRVLLELGREIEAADLLLDALQRGKFIPGAELAELMRLSAAATGRQEAFEAAILKLIENGDGQQPALFKMVIDWLAPPQTGKSSSDEPWAHNFLRNLAQVRRPPEGKTD